MRLDDVADLVGAARAGRRDEGDRVAHESFAALVRKYEGMAIVTARRSLSSDHDARDAVQDAFLDAWLKLPQLRDPRAFGAWIKRLVVTHCARHRRKGRMTASTNREQFGPTQHDELERAEEREILARAFRLLPTVQYRAFMQHYVFGHTLDEIARKTDVARGTIGKRLYSARLRIRRQLPPAVRAYFVETKPSMAFTRRISAGEFDDCLGTYRFVKRPELVVELVREGNRLVSYSAARRHVLAERRNGMLVIGEFDGEASWLRDARGTVTGFVYYEFGKRLGVAKKFQDNKRS